MPRQGAMASSKQLTRASSELVALPFGRSRDRALTSSPLRTRRASTRRFSSGRCSGRGRGAGGSSRTRPRGRPCPAAMISCRPQGVVRKGSLLARQPPESDAKPTSDQHPERVDHERYLPVHDHEFCPRCQPQHVRRHDRRPCPPHASRVSAESRRPPRPPTGARTHAPSSGKGTTPPSPRRGRKCRTPPGNPHPMRAPSPPAGSYHLSRYSWRTCSSERFK